MKILVIHGPNLNMLGKREPAIYGNRSLKDMNKYIKNYAANKNIRCSFFQSNDEGKIVDKLQKAQGRYDAIILNPAAFTHYSYAILDALKSITVPAVEVHISDIKKRESFRQISVTKQGCIDQISGLGFDSYCKAIDTIITHLKA